MRSLPLLFLALLAGCASGFSAQVTRFHEAAPQPGATVAVVPPPGLPDDALEFRAHAAAVERQLAALGFRPAPGETAELLAEVAVTSRSWEGFRRSPVTIGIGGGFGTGGRNSGVGIGGSVAVPVGGRDVRQLETELRVVLRGRGGPPRWEGRASGLVQGSTASVNPDLLARALFADYPGPSGRTVRWRPD
ncbi:MAG: DUF4136 domain-containing protein [Sphingomonadaceae bacterium]|uniref:DUF4136 domain-containing protein n=1 Tax=Thermaurantiacus sp. TaxID=2820283 RepID=UPI00298EE823|nr:DUF4136 domain-containing protein [Thermaurantiacus sp.]MCS6985973.1 DUF4136 domain-containing protein [Sphingomonadaceae bacterium]MDW8414811.1 DUF4136 domain-containing protein [Thermaurantiacus sp.]